MFYTYLIKFKPDNLYYYGVRYAKNAHPDELGVSYFSSSKHVKRLIENNSIDDFEFQVRKTFKNRQKAIDWENKVLRRMDVVNRKDFINKTNNKAICPLAASPLGRKHSEETKQKMSKSWEERRKTGYSEETLNKMREAKKGYSPKHLMKKIKINGITFDSLRKAYNYFESTLNLTRYESFCSILRTKKNINKNIININGLRIERI